MFHLGKLTIVDLLSGSRLWIQFELMHIAKARTKFDVHECLWININIYCMKHAGNGRTAKDAANDFCKTGIERLVPGTDAKCWQKTLSGALTLYFRTCVRWWFGTLSKYMYLISTFSLAALSDATLLRDRLRFAYFAWFRTKFHSSPPGLSQVTVFSILCQHP